MCEVYTANNSDSNDGKLPHRFNSELQLLVACGIRVLYVLYYMPRVPRVHVVHKHACRQNIHPMQEEEMHLWKNTSCLSPLTC